MKNIRRKLFSFVEDMNVYKIMLIVFIFAIILGAIYINLLSSNRLLNILQSNNIISEQLVEAKIDYFDLLMVIIKERYKFLLFVWILGLTFFGAFVIPIFIGFLGFSFGSLVAIATIQYGAIGLLVVVAFLLPHYLFYVPINVILMAKGIRTSNFLYFSRMLRRKDRKHILVEYSLVLFIALCLTLVGVILETYVNPTVIRFIFNKFL